MPGRPPHARAGKPGASSGRPIVAGVAPHVRVLSGRATSADLWASLDALAARPDGLDDLHRRTHDRKAKERFAAYIHQAKEYFEAVRPAEPVAKPLLAYYFALNLSKAFLTAVHPATTADKLRHGVSPVPITSQRYRFTQEAFRVQAHGVFRLVAEHTGQGFCWAGGREIQLKKVVGFLPEAADLYADAYGNHPRLIPVSEVTALFGEIDDENASWLRVEVDRNTLQERGIGAERLLSEAKAFGNRFRLVDDGSNEATFSYESKNHFTYHRRVDALPSLAELFDHSLFAIQRHRRGRPSFVVHSTRPELLSHEAVAFGVLHHLSDMVRYRPERVEALISSNEYWLFAPWVDRACENFLLAMASRIALEEHTVD